MEHPLSTLERQIHLNLLIKSIQIMIITVTGNLQTELYKMTTLSHTLQFISL